MQWRLAELWNKVAISQNRELKPRDYIYASEVGYPMIDRWLKMKAVPYTNPPNDRSLRKFFAGKVWEYVVKSVLLTTGAYRQEEVKVDDQIGNLLPVHGRLDFMAGGLVDPEYAYHMLAQQHYPEFLHDLAAGVIEGLAGQYLDEKILEIKAVSLYALEYVEKRKAAMATHAAQGYHYSRKTGIPAAVAYVSKDTSLMAEFDITKDLAEEHYISDIEQMTAFFLAGEQPPPEAHLSFDLSIGKFSKNLGIEYSPYLTMVYGFASPDDYRRSVDGKIKRWNNVLTRYAMIETGAKTPTGKEMKPSVKNIEARREIIDEGFDFNELLAERISHLDKEDIEEVSE